MFAFDNAYYLIQFTQNQLLDYEKCRSRDFVPMTNTNMNTE